MSYGILLDYYGSLLTERQRDLLAAYYNDDLSLSEISENTGISRQGVRDAIKRGEAELDRFESVLHIAASQSSKHADADAICSELISVADMIGDEDIRARLADIAGRVKALAGD